jgi:hypothetical protein
MKNIEYAYTLVYGDIPYNLKPIIEHNEYICKENGIRFEIVQYEVAKGECVAGESDRRRFLKASLEPRILYVDWDCKIEKVPEFDPAIPCVFKVPGRKIKESCAIYNGNSLHLFRQIYDKIICISAKRGCFGQHLDVLNKSELKSKLSTFSEECFVHLCYGAGREIL